jgi:hypothetical protein
MFSRRAFLQSLSASAIYGLSIPALYPSATGAADSPRSSARRSGKAPAITQPVLFNTPEADAVVAALQVYPPENAWNQPVDRWPVHTNSRNIIASIGLGKPLRCNYDMAYVLVPPGQKKIAVKITDYPQESDAGPYPVPENVPIEGWPTCYRENSRMIGQSLADIQRDKIGAGGDRHAIIVDPATRTLYEFWQMKKTAQGWQAAQASIFDLKTNRLRPDGWTSADAAGLPIFPAVVRYDEIKRGLIQHALRVTVRRTRKAYVAPATHFASRDNSEKLPRMGERIRLKSNYDISRFSPAAQVVLKGLKQYGMLVADNGLDWSISIAPDARIPVLHEELRRVSGAAFEVVFQPNTSRGTFERGRR